MKRAIPVILVIMVLSAPVAIARDDDYDFAKGLMERKYYDLAEEQFKSIVDDPKNSADKQANGELGLAMLLAEKARDQAGISKNETDEIVGLFRDAEKRFDTFLRSYPNHPKRVDAKFAVGNLLRSLGEYVNTRIEEEPDRAEELKKIAEDAFDGAIDLFSQVSEALVDNEDPLVDWAWRRANFYHCIAHYYKGLLYPEGGAERQGVLGRASILFNDFVWENEENLLGAYAYLYWGMVKQALGERDDAMEYYTVAATNYPVPDPRERPADHRNWSELFLQAYFKLNEYANEVGRTDDKDYREMAVEQTEEMLKRIPDAWDRKFGHLALLQYAKALSGLKRHTEAMDVVTKVSERAGKLAPSTEWGAALEYQANKLLNVIIEGGGGEDLPPDKLLRAAMAKKASRQWNRAVRAFQKVIIAAKTPEERGQYAIAAWMDIGECYYRAEKYYEAYYAYDHAERTFPKSEDAGKAAYYRYRAAGARHDETKDSKDEALKKKARSNFATKYKDHPFARDLQYFEGADYIADADSKKAAKKTDEAISAYQLATARLGATPKTSVLYEKAQSRVGEILYKREKYDGALKKFRGVQAYMEKNKDPAMTEQHKVNRKQALALSTYYTSLCYAKKGQYDKVLETIEGYEQEFADENVSNFHIPVIFERSRALMETSDLAKAEAQFLKLKSMDEENERTAILSGLLARALHKQAMAVEKKSDEWRNALTKASEYMEYSLGRESSPTWEDWQRIGLWYHELEDWEKAEQNLQKSLQMLTVAVDRMPAGSEGRVRGEKAREGLLVLLSEILLEQGKYAKARKVYEDLLITDKTAYGRVMDLLKQEDHSQKTLTELMHKIRAVPSLMEGLARIYKEVASNDIEMIRGINLVKLLLRASSSGVGRGPEKKDSGKYSPDWWRWNFLLCELYLDFGVTFRNASALRNVLKLVDDWNAVGVLQNSDLKEQFDNLRSQADLELQKMGK